jgi:hypothetical protein
VYGVVGKTILVDVGLEILSDPVGFVEVLAVDTGGIIMLVKLDVLD